MNQLGRAVRWLLYFWIANTLAAGPERPEIIPARLHPCWSGKMQHLVRDPCCGAHVSQDICYTLLQEGRQFHFCSRECREQYGDSLRCAARA